MGTKGARVTTEVSLPGRFLVLMPFSESIGVSRRLPDAERDRLHGLIGELAPEGVGHHRAHRRRRAPASGTSTTDLDFLGRLWARVRKQADTGVAPEVLYTEMDLALRMVRDVFTPDFRASGRRRQGRAGQGRRPS